MAYETGLDKSDKYSSSFEKRAELLVPIGIRDHVQSPLATILPTVGEAHNALPMPQSTLEVAFVYVSIRVSHLGVPMGGW
jgi:hypothetical protein